MSWETKKLCDLCLVITKGTTPSNIGEGFTEYGVKYIRSEMITSSRNISGEFLFISPETHEKLKRSQLQAGDILFSMAGVYLGKTALLREEDVPANTNQAVALIRVDRSKYNHQFIYYYLNLPQIVSVVNTIQSQSAQPNINLKQIGNLEIKLPNPLIQKKIADILSVYDDLIENNRKQIKLLEEAAQRLYKEWFVDLRFPGYEHTKITDGVPEGWGKCSLGDVIEFDPKVQLTKDRIKQFAPMSALSTSSMVLDMAEFSETTSNLGSKFQNGDTLLARITPCLENGKTAFVHGIQSAEGAVGSTEYIVMRSKRLNPYMVYLHARTDGFRQAAINSMSGSDGRQRVKADKLKALSYLLPTTTVVNQFGLFAAPIFELVFDLSEQAFQAACARERILPKLMSGEVEV